jgi:hypothetical protein
MGPGEVADCSLPDVSNKVVAYTRTPLTANAAESTPSANRIERRVCPGASCTNISVSGKECHIWKGYSPTGAGPNDGWDGGGIANAPGGAALAKDAGFTADIQILVLKILKRSVTSSLKLT